MLLLSFCPLPNVSVSSRLPSGDEGDNFYVIDQGEVDVSGRKELSHSHRKTTTYFLSLYIWLNQIEGRGVGCNQEGGSRVELWENVDFPNSWRDKVSSHQWPGCVGLPTCLFCCCCCCVFVLFKAGFPLRWQSQHSALKLGMWPRQPDWGPSPLSLAGLTRCDRVKWGR